MTEVINCMEFRLERWEYFLQRNDWKNFRDSVNQYTVYNRMLSIAVSRSNNSKGWKAEVRAHLSGTRVLPTDIHESIKTWKRTGAPNEQFINQIALYMDTMRPVIQGIKHLINTPEPAPEQPREAAQLPELQHDDLEAQIQHLG